MLRHGWHSASQPERQHKSAWFARPGIFVGVLVQVICDVAL